MGRTNGKTLITLELFDALLNNLDTILEHKGLNRSEVIRTLIDEYVSKHKQWI